MKKKFIIGFVFITLIIVLFLIKCDSFDKNNKLDDETGLLVKDYVPDKPMIKVFSGNFENGSSVDFIDVVTKNKIQVRTISNNALGKVEIYGKTLNFIGTINVYEKSDDEIKLIYMDGDIGLLAESYINEEQNFNFVVLKGPIKIGTKWISETVRYEITDVNVKVETPVDTFEAIEVTCTNGIEKLKAYYAKGIGLVKSESKKGFSELSELDYDVKKIKSSKNLIEILEKTTKP